jgi:transcriptional regulator with XRE-family HTH domain
MDTKLFGNELKNIRKSLGYTQLHVQSKTGISQDTLRRLENGIDYPMISTIENLSSFYKLNLYKIMSENHKISSLESKEYSELFRLINNLKIEDFKEQLSDLQSKVKANDNDPNTQNILRYLELIKNINLFDVKDIASSEQLLDMIFVNQTINIQNTYITELEISLSVSLSIVLRRFGKEVLSIELLKRTEERVLNLPYNIKDKSRALAVISINICTALQNINKYEESICEIDRILNNKKIELQTDDLFQLIYKKGISQFYNNDDEYYETLKLSLYLLKTTNRNEMFDFYLNHLETTHSINVLIK